MTRCYLALPVPQGLGKPNVEHHTGRGEQDLSPAGPWVWEKEVLPSKSLQPPGITPVFSPSGPAHNLAMDSICLYSVPFLEGGLGRGPHCRVHGEGAGTECM